MSWARIWVHLVFTTKNRKQILRENIRQELFSHIKQNATTKEIYMDCISGFSDHCHCLISLGKDQNISKIAQLIKGESSFWINKKKIFNYHFSWQDDYWAMSVSESGVDKVREYILNQEQHHKKKTLDDEIDEIMKKYRWKVSG
jgi:putative transposase